MTQKNETIPLLIALLATLGIVGGGVWWLFGTFNPNSGQSPQKTNQNSFSSSSNPVSTLAEVDNVPSGLFSYGGSTTWAPIRNTIDQTIQTVYPNFRLRYTDPSTGTPGSSKGVQMLLNDQLAFSQSSSPLKDDEYQQAIQRGFKLKQVPVAIDGIAIAVHQDLRVSSLTIAQLQAIYQGKITNWNQVGGPNLPITPYSRSPEDAGTVEFFINNILQGNSFGNNVVFTVNTTQSLRKLSETPGGIYYASAPEVVPQCTVKTLPIGQKSGEFVSPYQEPLVPFSQCPQQRNQLNIQAFQDGTYPITRRLFVVIKENGQIDEQAGIAYANLLLTNQGQDLITQAGFIRIR